MANTLLVGYDLSQPGQSYEPLWEYLKSQANWWHHLDSTWIISSGLSAKQLRDEIKLRLADESGEILVVGITGAAAAWSGFSDGATDWLRDNL